MALVALTLMAVPGNATFAKKYDLKILAVGSPATPSPAVAGSQTAFTATYTNKSIYKINSTVLTVPPNFNVVVTETTPSTTRGTISTITSTSVSVKDLNLSLGSSFTISLTASVPCVEGTSAWTALTKTGNFSGSSFSINNPGDSQRTKVTGSCNATIDIEKYEDSDLSAGRGDGEASPIEEFEFSISDSGGEIDRKTTVGGTTSFSVPVGGTYTVCESAKDGWTNTDPGGDGCADPITLDPSGASLQFGNAQGAVGELGCPSIGDFDPDPVTGGGSAAPTADLARDENADESDCEFVPYILETGTTDGGGGFVDFIKNLDQQASAQFLLSIDWAPEPAVYPIPTTTQVDYDGPGGNPPQDLDWCEPGSGGQLYGLPPSTPSPTLGYCLVSQFSEVGDIAGEINVTEVLYGLGDPRVTRG
jgi:hypothetical protein